MTLADRVRQADVAGKPDWQVADVLNAPDPSLPEIVELVEFRASPASIMGAVGVADGAALLDKIQQQAATNSSLKWAMVALTGPRGLDIGDPAVRRQIDALTPAVFTAAQAAAIKSLAERRRRPSWAETNGVEVTARSVGLARGAKE